MGKRHKCINDLTDWVKFLVCGLLSEMYQSNSCFDLNFVSELYFVFFVVIFILKKQNPHPPELVIVT